MIFAVFNNATISNTLLNFSFVPGKISHHRNRVPFHIIFIISISILDYLNTLVRISAEFQTSCVRMASMSHTYMCNFVFCLYFLLF